MSKLAIQVFKVVYHSELNGKQDQGFGVQQDLVAAASGDAATLTAVLVAAGKGPKAGRVLVFDSIQPFSAGTFLS